MKGGITIKYSHFISKAASNITSPDDLNLINQFAISPLSDNEVFTFSVILCDNEVDRDFERFTLDSLQSIASLFIGKTGIFDHDPKSSNQSARIFNTKIVVDPDKITSCGEPYTAVKAFAYLLNTPNNQDLIANISGGIKKEVSVSVSVANTVCSICNKNVGSSHCNHVKGQSYDGSLCFHNLDNVTDAYEWSFVAVPAQKNAGVVKHFYNHNKINSILKKLDHSLPCEEVSLLNSYINNLEKNSSYADQFIASLKKNTIKSAFLSGFDIPSKTLSSICDKLCVSELQSLSNALSKNIPSFSNPLSQNNLSHYSLPSSQANHSEKPASSPSLNQNYTI